MKVNRCFILAPLKKILLFIIGIIIVTIVFPVLLVGIGDNNDFMDNQYKNSDSSKYSIKPNDIIFDKSNSGGTIVKVYLTKEKKVIELSMEEYVRGVIASEMPAVFDIEALKAQTVAARTYAMAHIKGMGGTACSQSSGADLCDTTHCQVYMSKDERLKQWPEKTAGVYWNKITEAVKETTGQILTYKGQLVKSPLYFSVSGGRTENSEEVFSSDVPYLKSVSSPGEEVASSYKTTTTFTFLDIVSRVNRAYPKAKLTVAKIKSQIVIIDISTGGSIKKLKLGEINITGQQFRELFNLKSANFNFKYNSNSLEVTCIGYGHGVGMSQWGANIMAQKGKSYLDILTHYYQGIEIKKVQDITL